MLTIRKAGCDDAVDAWDIRKTSVHAACAEHYSEAALSGWVDGVLTDKWVSVVARDFYVAIDEELVVGTGMLTVENGQVDAIFVRPSHMGRGIGRTMLRFLEALAAEHGLVEMRLDATLNAAPFYRSCGWTGDSISTYRTSRGLELACVPMSKRPVQKLPRGAVYFLGKLLTLGIRTTEVQGWKRQSLTTNCGY